MAFVPFLARMGDHVPLQTAARYKLHSTLGALVAFLAGVRACVLPCVLFGKRFIAVFAREFTGAGVPCQVSIQVATFHKFKAAHMTLERTVVLLLFVQANVFLVRRQIDKLFGARVTGFDATVTVFGVLVISSDAVLRPTMLVVEVPHMEFGRTAITLQGP